MDLLTLVIILIIIGAVLGYGRFDKTLEAVVMVLVIVLLLRLLNII